MNGYKPLLIFAIISIVFAAGCTSPTDLKPAAPVPTDTCPHPLTELINEKSYWIRFDNQNYSAYAGDNLTVTGTTNIPPGETLNLLIAMPYLTPKRPHPRPFCFYSDDLGNTTVLKGPLNNTWSYTVQSNPNCFQEFPTWDSDLYTFSVNCVNNSYTNKNNPSGCPRWAVAEAEIKIVSTTSP